MHTEEIAVSPSSFLPLPWAWAPFTTYINTPSMIDNDMYLYHIDRSFLVLMF